MNIVKWVFGVLFFMVAAASIVSKPLIGLTFAGIACFLLPPISKKIKLPTWGKVVIVCCLFVLVGIFEQNNEKKEIIKEYKKNRAEIITAITEAFENKDYAFIVEKADKYSEATAKDEEFNKIADVARQKQEMKDLTNWMLAEYEKPIENINYDKMFEGFARLTEFDPTLDFTEDIQDLKVAKKEADKINKRKVSILNQFNVYDGSHKGLQEMVVNSMNDPSSYEHVSTKYIDKGDHISVTTSFRGKNAFGAIVIGTKQADYSIDGKLLRVYY